MSRDVGMIIGGIIMVIVAGIREAYRWLKASFR